MKHPRKKRIFRHAKRIFILIVAGGLCAGGIGFLWLASFKIPDLSTFETRKVSQSTKIYDRTGEILLYDIHEDAKRTVVPLNEISINIRNGIIAIEDENFYSHYGIVPRSILRAIIANFIPGGLTQGGSTITQQVIKNTVLTKDQTYTRKFKEWFLAVKLEQVLTKDQILETYLNESPWGGSIYGVEEACRTFFGKSSKDVTLAEAAYIAALPQAPSFYSPYGQNKDRLDARQRLVLAKMSEYGFITAEEYQAALAEVVTFRERNVTSIRAPHFSMYVRNYLNQKYGESVVEQGGLKVITTLDYTLQEKAEKVVTDFAPTLEKNFAASNTAMTALDPKTGDILVMVGSRNYFDKKIDGQYNIVTALRQPGSTFKPFVYATAFNEGYTADTILFDVETEFGSQCNPDGKPKNPSDDIKKVCYHPQNYDETFEGPITIRRALAQSRNIPAVKTLYLVGVNDAMNTAQDMGIDSLKDPNRYGLTLTLGGGEVSLLELTSAYGVFANDGIRNSPRAVLRVEDAQGNVLEEARQNPIQALPAQSARLINDILSDSDPNVRIQSLADIVNPFGTPVAAKTGTTNDYKDVWIVGYTPNLVVGSWAGKNDNTPMEKKVAGLIITPLWGTFMGQALRDMPKENFKEPEATPQDIKPVLRGIWKGGQSYWMDKVSKKLATEYTPPETREEVIFNSVHSILHWVDKDNPRGAVPSDPKTDSQYENWEYGVRNWFDKWKQSNPNFHETSLISIPTEKDNIHTEKTVPIAEILSPNSASSEFSMSSRISTSISIKAQYPIQRVEYFINDRYIGRTNSSPFNYTFTPSEITGIQEQNELKAVIYDSMFNRGQAISQFKVNIEN